MPLNIKKSPHKYRELRRKLKKFGIVEASPKRGKGSERMFLKPIKPGSKKGLTYPVKYHGENTEIYVPIINKILEKFNIPDEDFW